MLDNRFVKNGGDKMTLKMTPVGPVGVLAMARRTIDRATSTTTHVINYDKADLEDGLGWTLIPNRVYEFTTTSDTPGSSIRVEISFNGKSFVDETLSQGAEPLLTDIRVTTRKGA